MPCEGCHIQFTVFKRKRSCYDCKRYYCHNCLANRNNRSKHALCERCLLFRKRPLIRSDLIQLKPKDLIFYLQSKHISTAGCVEKEELIDLVLEYVNRTDMNHEIFSGGSGSSSGNSSQHATPQHQNVGVQDTTNRSTNANANSFNTNNSFESIKQSCQNFFSNLGDNISDSLANLENRACSKNRSSTNMTKATNVTEQPKVTTRFIPTYASSQQNSPENPLTSPIGERAPSNSTCAEADTLIVNLPRSSQSIEENCGISNNQEECKCFDDEEIIASFNGRIRSPKSERELQNLNLKKDAPESLDASNTNGSTKIYKDCAPAGSTSSSKVLSHYSKLEIYINDEDSSHSSFEELGAIGGISDDSKTNTDTTSNTTDHWQILDLKLNETETASSALNMQPALGNEQNIDKSSSTFSNDSPENIDLIANNHTELQEQNNEVLPTPTHAVPKARKVTRRRSESYLNRRKAQTSMDDEDCDVNNTLHNDPIEEEFQDSTQKRCCVRCGKNKVNIQQQLEKMRKYLESSQMCETDIKQELSEFLSYLEQRTKSLEYSDSERGISTGTVSRETNEIEEEEQQLEETTAYFIGKNSRFINLDEILSIKDLESLTVKQLKEILMLHRVDYKGCCEKRELLDRVERLWRNLKSSPAVENLQTDELCKICMDAPIECIILECGHMATCTKCGKVLSECPICRQYIVRVVRFFRS